MKKNILILGGSGFIGQNLIKKLTSYKSFTVTSVSKKNSYKFNEKVKFIKCDLTNISQFKKLTKQNYYCVINLSGNIDHKDKLKTHKIHNIAAKSIFKFFSKRKIKLFIHIGSSLEYGNVKSPHIEKTACKPKSFYGKSKLTASKFIEKVAKKKKISFLILRLYQIYGPMQKYDRLIPFVIKKSLLNKDFKCSSGTQLRDFLFIDDLVNLFIKILNNKKIKSGIYNVGYGKPFKVKKVIKNITNIIKKGNPLLGSIKMRNDESQISYPNINKIKKNFKWFPKTNILLGLKKTIRYYEKKN